MFTGMKPVLLTFAIGILVVILIATSGLWAPVIDHSINAVLINDSFFIMLAHACGLVFWLYGCFLLSRKW